MTPFVRIAIIATLFVVAIAQVAIGIAYAGQRLAPTPIGLLSCSIICMGKFGPSGFKPDHLARSCRNNLTGTYQWIDLVPRQPCNR